MSWWQYLTCRPRWHIRIRSLRLASNSCSKNHCVTNSSLSNASCWEVFSKTCQCEMCVVGNARNISTLAECFRKSLHFHAVNMWHIQRWHICVFEECPKTFCATSLIVWHVIVRRGSRGPFMEGSFRILSYLWKKWRFFFHFHLKSQGEVGHSGKFPADFCRRLKASGPFFVEANNTHLYSNCEWFPS